MRSAEGVEEADVGDAARSKLPLSHRLGFWNNCFILWGWVLVLSSFLVGGMVGTLFHCPWRCRSSSLAPSATA